MCGRFSLVADISEMQAAFPGFDFPTSIPPRYNIAPSQPILAIPNLTSRTADYFKWGLIPSWAKETSIGMKMINARSEGLSDKPSFRGPYKYKRCLIPSSGFFEWRLEPGTKQKTPYYIQLTGGQPFAIAGLWDVWLSPDGSEVKSCALITTEANSFMTAFHSRMPVILQPKHYSAWLDPFPQLPHSLDRFLTQFDAGSMQAHPVSTLVNSPNNDSSKCIASTLDGSYADQ